MPPGQPVTISGAVEGTTDEAVLRRLVEFAGGHLGAVYGKNGKTSLKPRVRAYNEAARHSPWIILVDLDHDANCGPELKAEWLPTLSPQMCFRVAVREMEAWLLADRQRFSSYFKVQVTRIPQYPETLADPKAMVIQLVSHSRNAQVRQDMLPTPGGGRSVGPAYTARIIEFAASWRPEVAAEFSPSLASAINCIQRLLTQATLTDQ